MTSTPARSRLEGAVLRPALGLVLWLAAELTQRFLAGFAPLASLDLRAAASLVSGSLFGPLGLTGGLLGSWMVALIRSGSSAALGAPLADAAYGAIACGLFFLLPGTGRGLPNLRSYFVYFTAAGLGGSLVGVAALMGAPGEAAWLPIWTSVGASVATALVFGTPLAAALASLAPRLLIPIPNEIESKPYNRYLPILFRNESESSLPAWRLAPRSPLAWLGPVCLTLAGLLLARTLPADSSTDSHWLLLVFAGAVSWFATDYGLRGGLIGAVGVSLAHLFSAMSPAADHASLTLFSLIAAFWGSGRQREARLQDRLRAANARLRQDLERTVQALRSAVAAKDAYTEGHLRRVAEYALAVGKRLGLSGRSLEMLEVASLLHDVGKIGIPEGIIRKPGSLDATEMDWIKRHPEIGARILEDLDGLRDAAPLVLYHQERWDGRQDGPFPGYPAGLSGEQIPLGARIIAVVDAFDAMTSDRPYRRALPTSHAIAAINAERGGQFDPGVVDCFLSILEDRPWGVPP